MYTLYGRIDGGHESLDLLPAFEPLKFPAARLAASGRFRLCPLCLRSRRRCSEGRGGDRRIRSWKAFRPRQFKFPRR